MSKIKDISAVILSGGNARRMGGCDKSRLEIGGLALIERVICVLTAVFSEVLIVTNEKYSYDYPGIKIYNDEIKGKGPLSGIYTGLCRIKNPAAFFAACDMPFLHKETIIKQAECFKKLGCECLLARIKEKIEPLHAIYKKSIKDILRDVLIKGEDNSIRDFLKKTDTLYMDFKNTLRNRMVFSNINTKEELQRVLDKYKKIQG